MCVGGGGGEKGRKGGWRGAAREETDFGQFNLGQSFLGSGVCRGGAPKGGAPKGGRPKMSRFFPSPASIFALFVSLWVSSGSKGLADPPSLPHSSPPPPSAMAHFGQVS